MSTMAPLILPRIRLSNQTVLLSRCRHRHCSRRSFASTTQSSGRTSRSILVGRLLTSVSPSSSLSSTCTSKSIELYRMSSSPPPPPPSSDGCNKIESLRYNQTRSFSNTTARDRNAAGNDDGGGIRIATTTTIDRSDPDCNIPPHIADKVLSSQPKLYQISPHPLYIIKKRIEDYFHNLNKKNNDQSLSSSLFHIVDDRSPIVSTTSNFDSLLIPPDHVSRSKSDTYYLNKDTCLRTHTSAHQVELLREGWTQFLCTGDVYRRDDIDSSHYPIFHQMEGVKVFSNNATVVVTDEEVLDDLKRTLEGLAVHLFGPETQCRWVDEYFPFTHPSLELEVLFKGENDGDDSDWLEVLGCGVMRPEILHQGLSQNDASSSSSPKAWAFGLGLERLAMILFEIPDIRLFWTSDKRFWKQFSEDTITKFQPYSKFPPCYKDVSFWVNNSNDNDDNGESSIPAFHVNELLDLLREVAGDLVENVQLVDQFVHPKTQRESKCYRITYRSMDRSLTNEEIDELQENFRRKIQSDLPSVKLR